MEDKKGFVSKLNEAIVGHIPNVEKVEYECYRHRLGKWKQEYVVVHYKGGEWACRCVNGTSCHGIYHSIAKLLNGGYYEENDDRLSYIRNEGWALE